MLHVPLHWMHISWYHEIFACSLCCTTNTALDVKAFTYNWKEEGKSLHISFSSELGQMTSLAFVFVMLNQNSNESLFSAVSGSAVSACTSFQRAPLSREPMQAWCDDLYLRSSIHIELSTCILFHTNSSCLCLKVNCSQVIHEVLLFCCTLHRNNHLFY